MRVLFAVGFSWNQLEYVGMEELTKTLGLNVKIATTIDLKCEDRLSVHKT